MVVAAAADTAADTALEAAFVVAVDTAAGLLQYVVVRYPERVVT